MEFLIIIAMVIVIGFLRAKSKQSSKITMEGGMKYKYRTLINRIKALDDRFNVVEDSTYSLRLYVSSTGVLTQFNIIQTFNKVTVQWITKSNIYGKHKMDFDFQEYGDQNHMADKVFNDISIFQDNIITSSGL